MVALTKTTRRMLERAGEMPLTLAAAQELVMGRIGSDPWRKINRLDRALKRLPQASTPLNHVFTDGMYQRSIFLPAGTLLTSRVHLEEHPYIVSVGIISVWSDETGWVTIEAFHNGITKPATRRILFAHTDTLWTTTHLNLDNERDPDKIVKRVTFDHRKLIPEGFL